MLIDCDRCQMRGIACADCVVGALINDRNAPSADPAAPWDTEAGDHAAHRDTRQTGRAHTDGSTAHTDGAPGPEIGEPERRALHALASAGLIAPLRLVLGDPEYGATRGDQPAGFPHAEAS